VWFVCQARFLKGFSLGIKVCAYSLTVRVTEGFVFHVKPSVGDQFIRMKVDCDRITIFSVSVAF